MKRYKLHSGALVEDPNGEWAEWKHVIWEDKEDWDKCLRASVPDRHKDVVSPVGAVQNYISELEQRLQAHGEDPLDEPPTSRRGTGEQ